MISLFLYVNTKSVAYVRFNAEIWNWNEEKKRETDLVATWTQLYIIGSSSRYFNFVLSLERSRVCNANEYEPSVRCTCECYWNQSWWRWWYKMHIASSHASHTNRQPFRKYYLFYPNRSRSGVKERWRCDTIFGFDVYLHSHTVPTQTYLFAIVIGYLIYSLQRYFILE